MILVVLEKILLKPSARCWYNSSIFSTADAADYTPFDKMPSSTPSSFLKMISLSRIDFWISAFFNCFLNFAFLIFNLKQFSQTVGIIIKISPS